MRRSWLVPVVMCGLATVAEAKRIACDCPTQITLPAEGATDVPLNARTWLIEGNSLTGLSGLGHLAPQREYSVESPRGRISFTTGTALDTTAPVLPERVHVSLVTSGSGLIETLALHGQYDPDTAIVSIELHDGHDVVTLHTTPRRLYLCNPRAHVTPGRVTVVIRAIDIAGNESTPLVQTIDVHVNDRGPIEYCGERHHPFRCGTGTMGLVLFMPFYLLGGLGAGDFTSSRALKSRES